MGGPCQPRIVARRQRDESRASRSFGRSSRGVHLAHAAAHDESRASQLTGSRPNRPSSLADVLRANECARVGCARFVGTAWTPRLREPWVGRGSASTLAFPPLDNAIPASAVLRATQRTTAARNLRLVDGSAFTTSPPPLTTATRCAVWPPASTAPDPSAVDLECERTASCVGRPRTGCRRRRAIHRARPLCVRRQETLVEAKTSPSRPPRGAEERLVLALSGHNRPHRSHRPRCHCKKHSVPAGEALAPGGPRSKTTFYER